MDGTFISKDPLGFGGGDTNVYRFVSSNPINLTDPSGMFAQLLIEADILITRYVASPAGQRIVSAAQRCASVSANNVSVYVSKTAEGLTRYVGITNNLARRASEHLTTKGINIEPIMRGLTRPDARAIEQALIETHGLEKNQGALMNLINSISQKNPEYAKQLQRGYELLKSIGY